ncbi:Vacuolar protein sorting-associated protein 70 [Rhodotorula kratochvilovae]
MQSTKEHPGKAPLLPLPSPSSSSSPPPRPALLSRTWIRAILAALALASLCVQLASSLGPAHALPAIEEARLIPLDGSAAPRGCSHHRHTASLTSKDILDTLLEVPSADGARNASRSYTNQTHVAGTDGDHRVALHLKAQWEALLGADADPEHKRVFEAGTDDSSRALTGHGRRKHGNHRRGHGKKHCGGLLGRLKKLARRLGLLPSHSHTEHGRHGHNDDAKPRVWTDTYYSLLSYPVSSSISLFPSPSASEPSFRAKLREEVYAEDPTSGEGVGVWHGFSKNGTARGRLVYASKGSKEDYKLLEANGIDVRGAVVIVQYGGLFRGLKVKAAAEAGAAAVLIYTDPIEDGSVTLANNYSAYPAGPARAPSSVQRGSVQYLSLYPGDPLTPGAPSYNPALPSAPERLPRDSEGVNVPSIPSLPLSYEDAVPLLQSLNGRGVKLEDGREGKPDGWKEGGLRGEGVEYWTGPGEGEVEVVNVVEEKITPIWNTYAMIPGQLSDEVVVLGNHHDAWTFGAGDPSSGSASVHETVRALGALRARGWTPRRSILLAAWDAEEYGLIGSTEFGEDFGEWLQERVVTYLNVDVSVSGSAYELNASPSLADLLRNVSAQVPDPDRKGKTLAERYGGKLEVDPLGSGSDFTVFLQRLGLASANFGLSRTRDDPVYHYHSNYDSFHWQSTYGDPSFERHRAISRVLGLATVRLADDAVLPLNTTAYAVELGAYIDKVAALPLASSLDLSRLRSLQVRIQSASSALLARAAHLASASASVGGKKKDAKELRRINAALRGFERGFLGDEQGLQGREWYRHLGVAPGRWLGYGATTLPGVTEALTLDQDADRAALEVKRLERAFRTILKGLEKAGGKA